MKKSLFILATAALVFASCNNDVKIDENKTLDDANEISFQPVVTRVKRAAGVDAGSGTSGLQTLGFKVRATLNSGGAQYFPETQFTWNSTSSTYNSTQKYYWPTSEALDFFAWAASGSDVTHTVNTYAFTVTPNATAASQSDLVVANTVNKTKSGTYDPSDVYNPSAGSKTSSYGTNGVPLNFRHAGAKVTITLTNSNTEGLDFVIRDASICNVKNSGVFTFNPATANTDGQDVATLDIAQWNTSAASNTSYPQAITSLTTLSEDWILVPQTFTYATQYNDADANDAFTGPCIKVSLKIKNHGSEIYIVGAASGENDGYVTAMWPLSAPASGWLPGKKYTYTVDLAGGGYFEKNNTGDMGLDPILAGAEIKFVTVTVDGWPAGDATAVYTGGATPVVP